MKEKVQHWQYTNSGFKHNFAFAWLTGRSFWYSLLAAIKHPIHPNWKAKK
jgi:hypothetical protein